MHGLIADAGFGAIFGLVVLLAIFVAVVGSIAAFIALIGFMFKIAGGMLRAVFGGRRPYVERRPLPEHHSRAASHAAGKLRGGGRKECRNKRCGCSNPVAAVYCARCGQRF